jgi:hypothetical protein
MASTRSKNTPGNYCLEQNAVKHTAQYFLDRDFAYPQVVTRAGDGLVQGRMGNAVLAQNPQDVESFLFGIGQTNLVTPATSPFTANLLEHRATTMMDHRVPLVMPENLVVHNDQRPGALSSSPLIVRP